ncbi:MAG TPA: hypothetical protein VFW22_16350 [Pseudolabrys sp.]|nr:hypothetical protein [Pseudolabrys sp.]
MDDTIRIDPDTAAKILELTQQAAGRECHMIVISFADYGDDVLGTPSICSSLEPHKTEALIAAVATIGSKGKPVIHRFDN